MPYSAGITIEFRRHSGVQEAAVKLWAEKGRLILKVSDQGHGFEPPPLIGPQATERHELGEFLRVQCSAIVRNEIAYWTAFIGGGRGNGRSG